MKTLNATPNVDGFVEYSLSRPDDLLNIEHVFYLFLFIYLFLIKFLNEKKNR